MDKTTLRLRQEQSLHMDIRQELSLSVNRKIELHWNEKISKGIVPTKVILEESFDPEIHKIEMGRLVKFEIELANILFENDWKLSPSETGLEVHNVGIGTGDAFKEFVPLANNAGYNVIAYDISSVGCGNGQNILDRQKTTKTNQIYAADIEFACQEKYMSKARARALVAARVLDVLTTQESNWKKKLHAEEKTLRTAQKIGALSHMDVLLIHPCAWDNRNAVCGDTTLYTLDEIKRYMERGRGAKIKMEKLGKVDFYGHIYTAALFRRKI